MAFLRGDRVPETIPIYIRNFILIIDEKSCLRLLP